MWKKELEFDKVGGWIGPTLLPLLKVSNAANATMPPHAAMPPDAVNNAATMPPMPPHNAAMPPTMPPQSYKCISLMPQCHQTMPPCRHNAARQCCHAAR